MLLFGLNIPDARTYLEVGQVLDIRVDQYRDLIMKLGYNSQVFRRSAQCATNAVAALQDNNSLTIDRVKGVALPRIANMTNFLQEEYNRILGPLEDFTNQVRSIQAAIEERIDEVTVNFNRINNWYYELSLISVVVPGLQTYLPTRWDSAPAHDVRSVLSEDIVSKAVPAAANVSVLRWQEIAISWQRALATISSAKSSCMILVLQYSRAEDQLAALFRGSGFAALSTVTGGDQAFKRAFLIAVGGVKGLRSTADRTQLMLLFNAPLDQQQEEYLKWRQVADPALTVYVDSLIGAGKGVIEAEEFAKIYNYKNSPFTPEEMFKFNNLMGLQKGVQDVFARLFLEYAYANNQEAFDLVIKQGPKYGAAFEDEGQLEFKTFVDTVNHIRNEALPKAADIAKKQHVDGVQFFGLGVDRDVLTANISLGNVDTATNVTVNFLGMHSNANNIGNDLDSSRDNLLQAKELSRRLQLGNTFAVVVSISHKTTDLSTVGKSDSAREAVNPVTDLLDGINYSRGVKKGGSPADLGFRLDTRWHSYATRDASAIAEAESKGFDVLETDVSSFSLYGSPGIISGLEASDFPADKVYVTIAEGDGIYDVGRAMSGTYDRDEESSHKRHENPDSIPGVDLYNSDGGDGYKAVTVHDRYVDQEERPGEYGYDNYNTSSNYATARIMNGLEPELLNETR